MCGRSCASRRTRAVSGRRRCRGAEDAAEQGKRSHRVIALHEISNLLSICSAGAAKRGSDVTQLGASRQQSRGETDWVAEGAGSTPWFLMMMRIQPALTGVSTLSASIDPDQIEARLNRGILHLTLSKAEPR